MKYRVKFTDPKTGKTFVSPFLETIDEACDWARAAEITYKTAIALIEEFFEDSKLP